MGALEGNRQKVKVVRFWGRVSSWLGVGHVAVPRERVGKRKEEENISEARALLVAGL